MDSSTLLFVAPGVAASNDRQTVGVGLKASRPRIMRLAPTRSARGADVRSRNYPANRRGTHRPLRIATAYGKSRAVAGLRRRHSEISSGAPGTYVRKGTEIVHHSNIVTPVRCPTDRHRDTLRHAVNLLGS